VSEAGRSGDGVATRAAVRIALPHDEEIALALIEFSHFL